jgi:hypothetical protein
MTIKSFFKKGIGSSAIEDTEDGVVIKQGIYLGSDFVGTEDAEDYNAPQKLDSEVGYYFCKWLRENGFPKVEVEPRWSPANSGDLTERLELVVRKA